MKPFVRMLPICIVLVGLRTAPGSAETTDELLEVLRSVGREGRGNAEAGRALRQLTESRPSALPAILAALDDAKPLAANWIRSAFESVADRTLKNGEELPAKDLETFLLDTSHDSRARRLAFEWLVKVDETARDRLVPGMLQDPSSELRREAVARLIDQAARLRAEKQSDAAVRTYRTALSGAVDKDQVEAIVEPLKALGQEVDLPKHFGFLTRWHIIGPFDNRGGKGLQAVYPPEKERDLKASYEGQLVKVRWQPISTDDDYGIVDIAEQIHNYKGSAMYLTTEFDNPKRQTVQIRLGTPNSWKLWLNGTLLFSREEYHRGMAMDQYAVDATLKPGRNMVLLKICQNEQEEDWAQRYQFQLRVCNAQGAAVLTEPALQTSRTPGD